MSFLRQTIRSAMDAVLPPSLFMTRGIAFGRTCRVALTFDDGPHPEHTPLLLDYLSASDIKATFFIIGERAEQHPELVRRIHNEGHAIGNHTFTHSEPATTSNEQFLKEVEQTRRLIQDLTGVDSQIMRPPKGKLTLGKLRGLWDQQQSVVLWNIDPRDYQLRSNKEMEHWCDGYVPGNGDVVLMHDNHPHASAAVRTIANLPRFDNVQFVRITDWLKSKTKQTPKSATRVEPSSSAVLARD